MKALAAITLVLLSGAAAAQDDGAACRSFCDVDAKQCRQDAQREISHATESPLNIFPSNTPSYSYDFTPERREQALLGVEKERRARSQKCGDARQDCRRHCAGPVVAPVAAPAASATP